MRQYVIPLNVAILDTDESLVSKLRGSLLRRPAVARVLDYRDPARFLRAVAARETNCLFINIFAIGVQPGLGCIERLPGSHPEVPICLIAQLQQLLDLPGVPAPWRTRLNHYFQLASDQPDEHFEAHLDVLLEQFAGALLTPVRDSSITAALEAGPASSEEIKQLQQLLATHRATLFQYLQQQAMLGAAHAPPMLAHGINEARKQIQRIKAFLRANHVPVADSPFDQE